jgi:hypothetical protein
MTDLQKFQRVCRVFLARLLIVYGPAAPDLLRRIADGMVSTMGFRGRVANNCQITPPLPRIEANGPYGAVLFSGGGASSLERTPLGQVWSPARPARLEPGKLAGASHNVIRGRPRQNVTAPRLPLVLIF